MRLATVRTDMGPFFVADIESRSQRCFSSEPPGQTRYFEKASDAALTDVLNTYGKLTIAATDNGATIDTSTNTTLLLTDSSTAAHVTVTVTSSATLSKAALVTSLNSQFATLGLNLNARLQDGTNRLRIDTAGSNIGLGAYVDANSTALAVALGLSLTAVSGTTMLTALKAIIYPSASTVALQNGDIDGVLSFANLSTADLATLCDAVRDAAAPELVETGPVLLSYVYGQISKFAGATFQPGGDRAGYPAGAAFVVLADNGATFTL